MVAGDLHPPSQTMTGGVGAGPWCTAFDPRGTYCITSSSAYNRGVDDVYEAWRAADSTEQRWHSAYLDYTRTTGVYNNSKSTNGYLGDWIQLQLPSAKYCTSFSIKSSSFNPTQRSPRKFRLFGSTNGSTWTQLFDEATGITSWSSSQWRTFQIASPNILSYYRLAVNEVGNFPSGGVNEQACVELDGFYLTESSEPIFQDAAPLPMSNVDFLSIVNQFAPLKPAPHSIDQFYRGGAHVKSHLGPYTISTSGAIDFGMFRGAYNNFAVFTYTGSTQAIRITGNMIRVKMWGAGGGRPAYDDPGNGGTGGYSEAIILLPSSGLILTVLVGKGGSPGPETSVGFGGGGGSGDDGASSGGQGGGRSAVQIGASEIITAGGGGGGGFGGTSVVKGGNGGGLISRDGYILTWNERGRAASQVQGGAGGVGVETTGTAGTQFQGGKASANRQGFGGGGGGGGWWGGGGGGGTIDRHGAGGGGSGFVGRSGQSFLDGTELGSATSYADTWNAADTSTWRTDVVSGCKYMNTKCLRSLATANFPPLPNDSDYVNAGGNFGGGEQHGLVVLYWY